MFISAFIAFFPVSTWADTQTALWRTASAQPQQTVSHQDWQYLLDNYLVVDKSGINLFRYGAVTQTDQETLHRYIAKLESVAPALLSKDQQMAYWINLYNAATVALIVEAYPVSSIKRVGSWFNLGPWDQEVVSISGHKLSLNDIEHQILRPIWQDPRIHYAVNCASIGCPNLAKQAYHEGNLEAQLEQQALEYVNHPRGVRVENDQLYLSSIYHWYQEDFGSFNELKLHLQQYAKPELKQALGLVSSDYQHNYDWSLNQAP
ncbi:DUF547 domain-containing protein [Motilimonas pumila]|uniref:DUF547 domain-containing protein n=2 Tax=Motilimonas pumila TaxID=2303987 RepID=A0A418YL16_9GAMM|nr:DUF547 domain-containing protein [Motilimonas pumila]